MMWLDSDVGTENVLESSSWSVCAFVCVLKLVSKRYTRLLLYMQTALTALRSARHVKHQHGPSGQQSAAVCQEAWRQRGREGRGETSRSKIMEILAKNIHQRM